MKIVTRVFSYNFRWLARQLICEALKFGDDGKQATVMLLEESDLCGPINFVVLVEAYNSNFYKNQWNSNFRKMGVFPAPD